VITYEGIYHEYETELAEAILPGADHLARERRAALSEMLEGMLRDGVEMTLYTVGDRLSRFVPQHVAESNGSWEERDLKPWTEQLRPEIFKALGDYFIEGGREKRIQSQQKLLASLAAFGIRIEGRDVLDAVLPWSGNWTKRFLGYALMGRPHGVRFFGSVDLPISSIRDALHEAGFENGQIRMFLESLN
jgi:hypothetical protein